jgi:hypothetical protein
MKYPFKFYTTNHQFYIYDKSSPSDTSSDNFWTQAAYDDRLAIENGILGIGTECYGPVKGEVNLLDAPNTYVNFNDYDHIVEAGIKINSGTIQILNCPDSNIELELFVDPGIYKVRIYSSNLSSVEGDEGNDFYNVEIWPDTEMVRRVLKRF